MEDMHGTTDAKLAAIMKRIRALLSIDTDHGATPEEAASAAAKAQALMLRYNVDRAKLDAATGAKAEYVNYITELVVASGPYITSHRKLMGALARTNFCRMLQWSSSARVALVGEQHNVDLVCELYKMLAADLAAMAEHAWSQIQRTEAAFYWNRELGEYVRHTAVSYKAEYYAGAVEVIGWRLQRQRQEAEAVKEAEKRERDAHAGDASAALELEEPAPSGEEVRALVLVKGAELEQAEKQFYPKVGKARAYKPSRRSEAYEHGRRAGQAVDISGRKRIG